MLWKNAPYRERGLRHDMPRFKAVDMFRVGCLTRGSPDEFHSNGKEPLPFASADSHSTCPFSILAS
jgi:hypothetical protein